MASTHHMISSISNWMRCVCIASENKEKEGCMHKDRMAPEVISTYDMISPCLSACLPESASHRRRRGISRSTDRSVINIRHNAKPLQWI